MWLWLAPIMCQHEVPAKSPSSRPCSTTDGTPCVFPFKLSSDGDRLYACTTKESATDNGKPWCATSVDQDEEWEDWGECDMTSSTCGHTDQNATKNTNTNVTIDDSTNTNTNANATIDDSTNTNATIDDSTNTTTMLGKTIPTHTHTHTHTTVMVTDDVMFEATGVLDQTCPQFAALNC